MTQTKWPAIGFRRNRARREWNLLIRRPFYMNLRLGRSQNALWIGRTRDRYVTIFNRLGRHHTESDDPVEEG